MNGHYPGGTRCSRIANTLSSRWCGTRVASLRRVTNATSSDGVNMPTVHRQKHGLVIISSRRGRYCTHQLSPDGARSLQERYGVPNVEELQIDVGTLIDLVRAGEAYTARGRRQ